ncbi:MAG TPA: hypothetical protein VK968_01350 [Roseimicrobium sp.]|nr:hypothetical protein [Roseimicrobium sp.]
MKWLGLDPDSHGQRLQADPAPRIPSGTESAVRGSIGFALVSFAGFGPWVFAGRAFYKAVGEVGLYLACLVAFLAVSGPALQSLILGRRNLGRAYGLFTISFFAYAILWSVVWFAMAKPAGTKTAEWIASLAGTAAMTWVILKAFKATDHYAIIWMALFVGHSAGYFAGDFLHNWARSHSAAELLTSMDKAGRAQLGRALWGLAYGLGFGAGIGIAWHAAQSTVRMKLNPPKS